MILTATTLFSMTESDSDSTAPISPAELIKISTPVVNVIPTTRAPASVPEIKTEVLNVRVNCEEEKKSQQNSLQSLVMLNLSLCHEVKAPGVTLTNMTNGFKAQLFKLTAKNYIVIHPGMMGSALNWTQNQYNELIQQQIEKNKIVCITGTAADDPYLNKIKEKFAEHDQVRWLQSQLNLKELITVLAEAEFVVAPSTGVAHLAASAGAKVHGIYSPVKVHHPRRWGPRGPQVTVHVPENVPAGQEVQSMLQLKVDL